MTKQKPSNWQELLQEIESLYPANSKDPDIRETGKRLLFEAIADCWENLPHEILIRYHSLCVKEEQKGAHHDHKNRNKRH